MLSLLPYISIFIALAAGYLLIKNYQTHMVLLFAGLAMLCLAVMVGVNDFLPKGVKTSGLGWFDIFNLMRSIATRQSSGVGFIIMVAGGFATYMNRIGAADALVRITMKPLQVFHQPYWVLGLAYILGQTLILVIPSAAGLAMLLLVVMFPILTGLGVSAAGAGAMIATTAGMTFAPTAGTAILAAKVSNLEPIVYLVKYQLPVAIPTILVIAVMHCIVQRYFDKKNDEVYDTVKEVKLAEIKTSPGWYALFPIVPLVLLIVFSPLLYTKIKLDTVSALFMVWVIAVLVELVRFRDAQKVFGDAMVMFKSMGTMFVTIVSLIICAEVFAAGLKATGLIALLLNGSHAAGLGMSMMTGVLTGIVGMVTFLTGSGVGAFSSFAALAPEVASTLGGSPEFLVTPMQFASGMFRAFSPIAGVVIACAGASGVSPMAIVRRTFVPMCVGIVIMAICNYIILQ